METLEARFGYTRLIFQKLVNNIQSLPNVRNESHRLLEFATELKTNVSAIASLGEVGLLSRSDLVDALH